MGDALWCAQTIGWSDKTTPLLVMGMGQYAPLRFLTDPPHIPIGQHRKILNPPPVLLAGVQLVPTEPP